MSASRSETPSPGSADWPRPRFGVGDIPAYLWRRVVRIATLRFLRSDELPDADSPNGAATPFRILNAQRNLLNVGAIDAGLAELRTLMTTGKNAQLRGHAAWALVCYFVDSGGPAQLPEILPLIERVRESPYAAKLGDRLEIMHAEALALGGDPIAARAHITRAIRAQPSPNLWLALARYLDAAPDRIQAYNECLKLYKFTSVKLTAQPSPFAYDQLEAASPMEVISDAEGAPLVTVLVPAFNAEPTILTTLRSLSTQTHRALEILVIDDASTDRTAELVHRFAVSDPRIRLLTTGSNGGPYVARNVGLAQARGKYVTCNDADDWSHPAKIALQVAHLEATPDCIANTSQQTRVEEDLRPTRRGNAGYFIQLNISSLMFRRETVMAKLGYWDCVRFAGDSEFLQRLKVVFGPKSVAHLRSGPLSFQRQSPGSLTSSATLGYQGFKYGARLAYEQLSKAAYESGVPLRYDFPMTPRPFVVPAPMRLVRTSPTVRRFDVVLVSEFRLMGGTNHSNAEEIKAQRAAGLRTGLVQMALFHLNQDRPLNPGIFRLVDGEQVDWLVYGETIECDLVIIRHPWILQHAQRYLPQIRTRHVHVIVNQPPKRDYAKDSPAVCDLRNCDRTVQSWLGQRPTWHPIGPLVREALLKHHREEVDAIGGLAAEDWFNIIDLDEWKRPTGVPRRDGPIRICRHSRDQYVKWPANKKTLQAAYPSDPDFEIHVLGGAELPKKVFGGSLPSNWRVLEFGAVKPVDFLREQDVFVYYTHPDWVESFGRSILEAMAVGLPVILPPIYRPLFRDAAIYCAPEEVESRIRELMADRVAYERQVTLAHAFVSEQFGHEAHLRRIRPLASALSGVATKAPRPPALPFDRFEPDPAALAAFATQRKLAPELLTGSTNFENSSKLLRRDIYCVLTAKGAPLGDKVRIRAIHLNKAKRFSNSLIQLTNAIALAERRKIPSIICPGFWYLGREPFTLPNGVTIHPTTETVRIRQDRAILSGEFFYRKSLRRLYAAPDRGQIVASLRPFVTLLPTGPAFAPDELVIHLRAGDIFDPAREAHPGYGQPPLAYYQVILTHQPWSHVHLVYENRANPVIDALEQQLKQQGIPFSVQSGSLEDDLNFLLRARTLVGGRGTFLAGVAMLSLHLERIFFFENRRPELPSRIQQFLVRDKVGDYRAAILSRNWQNTPAQRELMLSYPLSSLTAPTTE